MQAMRDVLITSADGAPTRRHRLVASTEWDEVQHWCRQIYLPYDVTPAGPARQPDAVLDAVQIGQFTLSRFSYGVPVHLSGFDEGAGIGLALTTLQGAVRHWSSGRTHADTGVGDSYLVDLSRAHYRLDADARHLQVNLTFRHDAMAALHQRWFGCPADERMWARAYRFGGAQSSWMQLLGYVCRCITEMPDAVQHGPLGRHLEEMIGVHLLTQWRQQLDAPHRPRCTAWRRATC